MPENISIVSFLITSLIAYLLGSISFALIFSNLIYKEDIRKYGSKNAGATNMMRTYGWQIALLTLLGDALKGVIAVIIGNAICGSEVGGYLAGLFCIIGHILPVFAKFKGGKGVATGAGIVLILNPVIFFIMLIILVGTVTITKFVSLGSCLAALVFSVLTIVCQLNSNNNIFIILCSIVMSAIIIWKHRTNIKRLLSGTESKISFKKKDN